MIILGISFSADAGACVVTDGKLKSVINEERLNRKKLFHGIPEESIKWVLRDTGLKMGDIDFIVTQGYCFDEEGIEFIDHGLSEEYQTRDNEFEKVYRRIKNSKLSSKEKARKLDQMQKRFEYENHVMFVRNLNRIRSLKKFGKPIKVIEHHMAHAAAAYFASGWNSCFIMTVDGWGEMESSILCSGRGGKIKKLAYSNSFDSLGYFYGSVTKALGFTPHRHEGKILGLSASGDPRRAMPWMKEMIRYNRKRKRFEGGFEKGIYASTHYNESLDEMVKKYKREDIAAAAQRVLERVVLEYIKDNVPKGARLAVAGGIFANVRLNQKIINLPKIKDIFVYPQMGDGGLAAGSALYYYSKKNKLKPDFTKEVYYGPSYTNRHILNQIKKFGYKYEYHANIEEKVARLLAEDNVIMRFAGRMEYGPRALGNRSILFTTTDKSVNYWLNKALKRSEFMPFAPVTLKEHALKCYKNIKDYWKRALHMTMTFDCTPYMKKVSPGVIHVDGTARPQIITEDINRSYYKILKFYHAITGIPSLINTSFNMHEEPIVCTPYDALRAFKQSKLKFLAIESYMVYRNKTE